MTIFKKVFKDSDFYTNVLTLLKGSVVAQLIPLLVSPVLTRMYTPTEFGVLALFTSFSTILGSVINGRYEQALVLVKSEKEAKDITVLSLIISLVMSILLMLFLLIVDSYLFDYLESTDLNYWVYFIPLIVLGIGVYNTLNYYELRRKNFKFISNSDIYRSFSFASVQLLFPIFKKGVFGLIVGKIISTLLSALYLWRKSKISLSSMEISNLIILAKRYKDFPIYTNASILLNNLSVNAINILIPFFYSTSMLGFYALMNKVLSVPFVFIGNSIQQVFLEDAVRQKQKKSNAYQLTKRMVLQLGTLSFLGFGGAFFIIEDGFAFIFGEDWRISGLYAKCLLPFFMFKFIASPLTIIHTAFEKQKLSFVLQLIMFVLSLFAIVFAYYNSLAFESYLFLFSCLMSLFYIYRIIVILRIAKNQ